MLAHPVARLSKRLKPDMPTKLTNFEAPMRRALELALKGPAFGVNPQVGAVLLNASGEIVAEGWHNGAGTDHAEVAALNNLAKKGISPVGLTAVVTLEPCNHTCDDRQSLLEVEVCPPAMIRSTVCEAKLISTVNKMKNQSQFLMRLTTRSRDGL